MNTIEEQLIELKKIEKDNNKKLLRMEVIIGFTCILTFLIIIFVVSFTKIDFIPRIILIITSIINFIIGLFFAIKIEREVGYYQCEKCNHKYIPNTLPFIFSMHYGRTRYLECPKCNKKSWNKKVLTK